MFCPAGMSTVMKAELCRSLFNIRDVHASARRQFVDRWLYPTSAPQSMLSSIHDAGVNCVIWCNLALRPELAAQGSLMLVAATGGPHRYCDVSAVAGGLATLTLHEGPVLPSRDYLIHLPAKGGERCGHCVIIRKEGACLHKTDLDARGVPATSARNNLVSITWQDTVEELTV